MTPTAIRAGLLAGAASLVLFAQPARAEQPACEAGRCVYKVKPEQLLARAEQLVLTRDFAEAQPLLDAMAAAPGLELQHRFLAGYVAVETGDLDGAIKNFRAILNQDPSQTRVRLELARALLLSGQEAGADHHFRLAQQDDDLPEEISRTISSARGVLRSRRVWHFNFDFGFAPDSNINNATAAESIDVRFGSGTVPLELDDEARKRSGIGQTASFSSGARVRLDYDMSILVEADGQALNYSGKKFDDFSFQLAAGPELKLDGETTVSLQAIAQQRWYGGKMAARQFGAKAAIQRVLDAGQRVGLQLDVRNTHSGFSSAYDGWQISGYATYERVVEKSLIASATLYARRDLFESKSYSSTDYGFELGIGGELPWGINAGVSAGLGHASFDAPLFLFSEDERSDWRFNGRAYIGLRSVKLWDFSPSVTYTYGRVQSNYDLYETDRHRLRFNLARYF